MPKLLLLVICAAMAVTLGYPPLPLYAQEAPKPPRLGISVRSTPRGQRITAIEPNAPIGGKLKVGDVIVRGRAAKEGVRFRMDVANGLHDVRVALGDGQNVILVVDRPSDTGGLRDFARMEIELVPSDLFGELGAYEASEPVGEYRQYSAAREELEMPSEANSPVTVQLFYATDRAYQNGEYGGERDLSAAPVKFGLCEVSIPPDHRMGEIESPKWWHLEFSENPLEHVVIKSTLPLSEEAFFATFARRLSQMSPEVARTLVFIHGYNVEFGDAAKRTAQMHYDLNFPGVPCFYSWPSNGTEGGYVSDAEDVNWSVPHIARFLSTLEARDDIDEIYVIAHSMGNRGLVNALLRMADKGSGKKIKEIILAAPDIDAVVFERDVAKPLSTAFGRTTLYASSKDLALSASNRLASMKRAGQIIGGFPTISPQTHLDIIDASDIDTGFLGHSYYGDEDSLISDIFNLIHNHQAVAQRARLRAVAWPRGTFYRFAK